METYVAKSKRITKNTIALYIRLFFLMLIGLYTSRVVLGVLGVEDFGIYNLVGGIIFIANFVSNALALSIDRYLAFNIGLHDIRKLKETFSMAVNIHVIIAVIILVFGETVGLWFVNTQLQIPESRMLAAQVIYHSSIFSFVLYILGAPFNSDIIAHEKMGIYALVGIIQGVAKLAVALTIPFVSCDKLVVYALLMTIPSILYFVFNVIYTRMQFVETRYSFIWSQSLFKEMSEFAGYSTFGNMATAVVNQGQSVLLNIFYGPTLNAVRGLSMQINNALTSFINGVYTAVNPQIIKSYAQHDSRYFQQLIFYSTISAYYVLFLLVFPLFLEADFVLNIWLEEIPEYTLDFVRLILVNSLIYNFVTPSWMAIQATGHVAKIQLVTGCINLSNILITYVLWKCTETAPHMILVINILVSTFMQIATIAIQRRQLGLGFRLYFTRVIFPVISSSAIAVILPLFVYSQMEESLARFMVIVITSLVCSIVSFYWFGITKELRVYINGILIHRLNSIRKI